MRIAARISRLERRHHRRPGLDEALAAVNRELESEPGTLEARLEVAGALSNVRPGPDYMERMLAAVRARPEAEAALGVYAAAVQRAKERLEARGWDLSAVFCYS